MYSIIYIEKNKYMLTPFNNFRIYDKKAPAISILLNGFMGINIYLNIKIFAIKLMSKLLYVFANG